MIKADNGLEIARACREFVDELPLLDSASTIMSKLSHVAVIAGFSGARHYHDRAESERANGGTADRRVRSGGVRRDIDAWIIPIEDSIGVVGRIIYEGASPQPEPWIVTLLDLAAVMAVDRLSALDAQSHSREVLSPREAECLGLVAEGKTAREISSELGLSSRTVESYVTSAMSKLGAVSRPHAVARAFRRGIIS